MHYYVFDVKRKKGKKIQNFFNFFLTKEEIN